MRIVFLLALSLIFSSSFTWNMMYNKNDDKLNKYEREWKEILSFEEKGLPRSALDKVEEIAIDFFPEGGDLVEGISSRVGFKIIDQSSGNGIPATGKILDQDGKTVAFLKTIKFGLGIFNFTPESSQQYTAEIEFKSRIYKFQLPSVLSKGYVMQISNRDVDNISVQLSTNLENGIKGLYLVWS